MSPPLAPNGSRLRSAHLTRPWGRLRVWQAGDGPPLLLIHGLGGSGRYWQALADAVADSHHVVAPDLAGFGGSSRTARAYDRAAHLDDIDAVVERFAPSGDIVVAGHSLGGLLAALWVARRRERAAGLAVVAAPFPTAQAPPWLARPGAHQARHHAARRALRRAVRLAVPAVAVPVGLARGYPLDMVIDFTRQTAQSRDGTMRSLLGEPEVAGELAALAGLDDTVPVLLLAASDDRLVPPSALRRWVTLFPHAEAHLLGDGGHQLLLGGGRDVLVRWLATAAGTLRMPTS